MLSAALCTADVYPESRRQAGHSVNEQGTARRHHIYMAMSVGKARRKFGVHYPAMYASDNDANGKQFNCVQRGAQTRTASAMASACDTTLTPRTHSLYVLHDILQCILSTRQVHMVHDARGSRQCMHPFARRSRPCCASAQDIKTRSKTCRRCWFCCVSRACG